MRTLRDTQARLRHKVKFYGLENAVVPFVASAMLSSLALSVAVQRRSVWMGVIAVLPFVCTVLYLLIFVTGRRPHFTRDVVCLALYGRSVSPLPPNLQPRHPALPRAPRAVHDDKHTILKGREEYERRERPNP